MKKQNFSFFMLFLLLTCILYGIQKQEKSIPQEKHEVIVRLILVDVIVTKDGKFVTDLTKEDFELYEDEIRIPINSFELISFEEKKLVTVEEKPKEVIPNIPKKQLVVVFDGINSWQRNLKKGARKIVDELVSLAKLGHEVMVIQLSEKLGVEILQHFTTKEDLIRKALIIASVGFWYDESLDAFKMLQEVGIEDIGPMSQVDRHIESMQPVIKQDYLYRERVRFEKALGGMFAIANMIKELPGRKSILLIGDGFPDLSSDGRYREMGNIRIFDPFNILDKKKTMHGDEVIKELIRFANAHNIAIYSIDPATFTRNFFTASAEYASKYAMDHLIFREKDKLERTQNLAWISKDTGAVSLRGAEKYERFHRVMKTDLNYYYELSYYPPRKEEDNQYHKIKVNVKRSGVDIRFREGYTDYSKNEKEKMLIVSAFYSPSLFKELPFKAEFIAFHINSKKYEPWMNIALPTRKLFVERGVAYGPKQLNLHVWIKDKVKDESTYGGQVPIPFNIDSSFMNFLKTTDYLCFHYKGPELSLESKKYQVIFAIVDSQTNEIGTWESTPTLPDFKKEERGSIINCVLGLLSQNPKKGKQSFSISQEDGSLEYGDIKFFPSIVNQFQRMQDASVFLQVFIPQGKIEISPEVEISGEGRLTQHLPGELVAESWNEESNVWSGIFNLNLKNVIFGDYSLKVEIPVSEKGFTLSREVKLIKLRN
jgi:VWFA-related protein